MAAEASQEPLRIVGRYALYEALASGGMATVHYGRLRGPVGFSRTVAIKRLHPEFARDPEFVSMFLDEARLAARIRHPNVVQTLDVVAEDGELFLVMEYVQGESLSHLARLARNQSSQIPHRIVAAVMSGMLQGLHAAHETRGDQGESLGLVHRDVSPQNVLVGADGLARVLDFGVAKAAGRVHTTREGKVKGKLAYMAPEQIQTGEVTRAADIYSASVVLWEVLTGRRLFQADNQTTVLARILAGNVPPPSSIVKALPAGYDEIVAKGLARSPAARFESALEMALALERVDGAESGASVAQWMTTLAGNTLEQRAARVATIEQGSEASDIASIRNSLMEAATTGHSQSGVVSVPARPSRRRIGLWAGVSLGVIGLLALTLMLNQSDEPAPEVVELEEPAAHKAAPPQTEVANNKPPSNKTPPEEGAEAAPTASAKPAPVSPPKRMAQPAPRALKPPSTSATGSGKKPASAFDNLGGRH